MNTSTDRPISIVSEGLRLSGHAAHLIPVFAFGMELCVSVAIWGYAFLLP